MVFSASIESRAKDGHQDVASYYSHEVLRYDGASGEFKDVFVSPGSGDLDFPGYLAFANLNGGGLRGLLNNCFINSLKK